MSHQTTSATHWYQSSRKFCRYQDRLAILYSTEDNLTKT